MMRRSERPVSQTVKKESSDLGGKQRRQERTMTTDQTDDDLEIVLEMK